LTGNPLQPGNKIDVDNAQKHSQTREEAHSEKLFKLDVLIISIILKYCCFGLTFHNLITNIII